jgi:hypothetical protein
MAAKRDFIPWLRNATDTRGYEIQLHTPQVMQDASKAATPQIPSSTFFGRSKLPDSYKMYRQYVHKNHSDWNHESREQANRTTTFKKQLEVAAAWVRCSQMRKFQTGCKKLQKMNRNFKNVASIESKCYKT